MTHQARVENGPLKIVLIMLLQTTIELQRQRLQTETAEVNLLKSKMDVLPSLSVGSMRVSDLDGQ